jgi:hypothetical protein
MSFGKRVTEESLRTNVRISYIEKKASVLGYVFQSLFTIYDSRDTRYGL